MRIGLAQIDPIVGDVRGNARKIVDFARRAEEQRAALVVFPELALTGYPPQDLLERGDFLDAVRGALDWIAASAPPDVGVLLGAPVRNPEPVGKRLFNAALLYAGGELQEQVYKVLLPTYDIYDEYRYFEPGPERRCIAWRGLRLGVHLCEDMWNMEEGAPFRMYSRNPIEELALDGADLLVNLSATPFAAGKNEHRGKVIGGVCRHFGLPLVMVNQVGATGELVFDGRSRVHGPDGSLLLSLPAFEESLVVWDGGDEASPAEARDQHDAVVQLPSEAVRDLHDALILGIRDYVRKTGLFRKVLLGVSGGIDSAVTCALAAAAVGPDRVVGVAMPGPHSSPSSLADARSLASALGVELRVLPIDAALEAFDGMLSGLFEGTGPGIAEENIQARIRGVALMALSNKFDYLLLATGNKSEAAVGYTTLYGDMCGGLSVLGDVFKTQVYELAEYFNRGREVIPRSTIERPPSAELRAGQTDQDILPPYEVLDPIVRFFVEEGLDGPAIAERGFELAVVRDVVDRIERNEFKRRQAPPALRVTRKAFGSGRRVPVPCSLFPGGQP